MENRPHTAEHASTVLASNANACCEPMEMDVKGNPPLENTIGDRWLITWSDAFGSK